MPAIARPHFHALAALVGYPRPSVPFDAERSTLDNCLARGLTVRAPSTRCRDMVREVVDITGAVAFVGDCFEANAWLRAS